jgi:hypothetical protein
MYSLGDSVPAPLTVPEICEPPDVIVNASAKIHLCDLKRHFPVAVKAPGKEPTAEPLAAKLVFSVIPRLYKQRYEILVAVRRSAGPVLSGRMEFWKLPGLGKVGSRICAGPPQLTRKIVVTLTPNKRRLTLKPFIIRLLGRTFPNNIRLPPSAWLARDTTRTT